MPAIGVRCLILFEMDVYENSNANYSFGLIWYWIFGNGTGDCLVYDLVVSIDTSQQLVFDSETSQYLIFDLVLKRHSICI